MRGYWTIAGVTIAGALCVVVNSCGGGNDGPAHVEISGKTPGEGAAVVARAVCVREARCGRASITCSGSGSAGGSGSDAGTTFTCAAMIRPVVYDDCFKDVGGDLTELLACPALTPADIDTLEICVDALIAPKCETQAEADARARASEAGMGPTRPAMPAACAILTQPPPGC